MPDTRIGDAPMAARSEPDLHGLRVLLVTDRPFLHPVDGSAHTYLMWLHALAGLGCQVSVLSFSRFSQPWTDADRAELDGLVASALILDAQPGRVRAAAAAAVSACWRVLAGRRFLPQAAEHAVQAADRSVVAAFLQAGRFQAVVVNKLLTTTLTGRDLLRSGDAIRLIDMHDNVPRREHLNRVVFARLLRRHGRRMRGGLNVRDAAGALGWAGQRRLLREEVRRLAPFDHVVFNAREEAAAYQEAGLPAARVAVLPLPRPDGGGSPADDRPRPFELGLIGSAALSNLQAVDFLAREIMPRLAGRRVRLLVAGTVGRFAREVLPPDRVEVLGWIEDVSQFYDRVEVVLVPLLTGTGVSVKTMEAANHGAAIVSTTVGVRGVDLVPGQDAMVADGADAFAGAVATVLDDPGLRASLRRNSRDALRLRHSREAFAAGVVRLLRPALTRP